MNKNYYQEPALRMVIVQQSQMISASVQSVQNSEGITYGCGNSGPARAPRHTSVDWEEWE